MTATSSLTATTTTTTAKMMGRLFSIDKFYVVSLITVSYLIKDTLCSILGLQGVAVEISSH